MGASVLSTTYVVFFFVCFLLSFHYGTVMNAIGCCAGAGRARERSGGNQENVVSGQVVERGTLVIASLAVHL